MGGGGGLKNFMSICGVGILADCIIFIRNLVTLFSNVCFTILL